MEKAAQKKPKVVTAIPAPMPTAKVLKNHFVLVRDCSGSMARHASGALRLFQEQLRTLRETKGQQNAVTIFDFGREPLVDERCYNTPAEQCSTMSLEYRTDGGSTPLYDAVMKAAARVSYADDPETSYVMVVLTDGEENASKNYGALELRACIEKLQSTDRWTFVFLVPPGYKNRFVTLSGVHTGNVAEWSDATAMAKEMEATTSNYMLLRTSSGGKVRSTKSWFQADLSGVTATDLAKLQDITGDAKVWDVRTEADIKSFVNRKTKGDFAPGCGYYQLMKKEDAVQDYKHLLLLDNSTGRLYADGHGATVRDRLGFPRAGTISLEPGNHAGFTLFVQSTSTNRILPRGTKLAYWK